MSGQLPESLSAVILMRAIRDGRASELLHCLFEGGTCTLDPTSGGLVLISGDMLAQVADASFGDDAGPEITDTERKVIERLRSMRIVPLGDLGGGPRFAIRHYTDESMGYFDYETFEGANLFAYIKAGMP